MRYSSVSLFFSFTLICVYFEHEVKFKGDCVRNQFVYDRYVRNHVGAELGIANCSTGAKLIEVSYLTLHFIIKFPYLNDLKQLAFTSLTSAQLRRPLPLPAVLLAINFPLNFDTTMSVIW